MELNLYRIYKSLYTKGQRTPDNDTYQQARLLLKKLCVAIHNHDDKNDVRKIIRKIKSVESDKSYKFHTYAEEILHHLRMNNIIAGIPHTVLRRWTESENCKGLVYLAVSDSKKGQVKIGATTMLIDDRLKAYYSKYNYHIKAVWSEKVDMPFKIEKKLQDYFKDYRVAGQTDGDSNEWYFGEVDTFISVAEDYITES